MMYKAYLYTRYPHSLTPWVRKHEIRGAFEQISHVLEIRKNGYYSSLKFAKLGKRVVFTQLLKRVFCIQTS